MADRLTRRGLLGALAALPFVGRAFRRKEPPSLGGLGYGIDVAKLRLEPEYQRLFSNSWGGLRVVSDDPTLLIEEWRGRLIVSREQPSAEETYAKYVEVRRNLWQRVPIVSKPPLRLEDCVEARPPPTFAELYGPTDA